MREAAPLSTFVTQTQIQIETDAAPGAGAWRTA
jgi:hypothetical protein